MLELLKVVPQARTEVVVTEAAVYHDLAVFSGCGGVVPLTRGQTAVSVFLNPNFLIPAKLIIFSGGVAVLLTAMFWSRCGCRFLW